MSRFKNLSFNPALEFALVFALSLGVLYFICSRAIGLPGFGDETQAYIPYAYAIYLHNGARGSELCMPCIGLIHPPLYYMLVALVAKTLGWSIPLLRWISLVFTALTATGVYALCRFRSSRALALSATLVCLTSHFIFLESVHLTPDVPACAIALWSFYFLFKRRTAVAVVLISLGALTNTPFLFLMPAFAWTFRDRIKQGLLYLSVPLAIFACWILLFQMVWGNSGILSNFGVIANLGWIKSPDLITLLERGKVRTLQIFSGNFRFIMTALSIAALLLPSWRKFRIERDALLAALLCQWVGTVLFGLLLFRYLLFSYAAIIVVGVYALSSSDRFRSLSQTAGSLLFLWIALASYTLSTAYEWEEVAIVQALVQKLPQDPKTLIVCDSFVFCDGLRFPESGYVSTARKSIDLDLRPQDALKEIAATPIENLVILEATAGSGEQLSLPDGRMAQLSHCVVQTGNYNLKARFCRIDSIR